MIVTPLEFSQRENWNEWLEMLVKGDNQLICRAISTQNNNEQRDERTDTAAVA